MQADPETERAAAQAFAEPKEEVLFKQWVDMRSRRGALKGKRFLVLTRFRMGVFREGKKDFIKPLVDLRSMVGAVYTHRGELEIQFDKMKSISVIFSGGDFYKTLLEAYWACTSGWPYEETAIVNVEDHAFTQLDRTNCKAQDVPGGRLPFLFGTHACRDWSRQSVDTFKYLSSMQFNMDRRLNLSVLPAIEEKLSLRTFFAALRYIAWFRTVEARDVKRPDMLRKMSAVVAGHNGITTLRLVNCGMRKKGCSEFAKSLKASPHCCLTALSLAGNDLGNSGIADLAPGLHACPQLLDLDLSECSVRHQGMVSLFQSVNPGDPFNKIAKLDLSRNALGPKGTAALAAFLRNHSVTALRTLVLDDCQVAIMFLLPALAQPRSPVENLSLKRVVIEDSMRETVAASLSRSRVRNLNVSRGKMSQVGAVALVEGLMRRGRSVTDMQLDLSGIRLDGAAQALASLFTAGQNLHTLVLDDCAIGGEDMLYILYAAAEIPTFRALSVARNMPTGPTATRVRHIQALVRLLGPNSMLESLGIAGNAGYPLYELMPLFQACSNSPYLTSLDMSDLNFGDDGVKAMCAMLRRKTNMGSLAVSGNPMSLNAMEDLTAAVRPLAHLSKFKMPLDVVYERNDEPRFLLQKSWLTNTVERNARKPPDGVVRATEELVQLWAQEGNPEDAFDMNAALARTPGRTPGRSLQQTLQVRQRTGSPRPASPRLQNSPRRTPSPGINSRSMSRSPSDGVENSLSSRESSPVNNGEESWAEDPSSPAAHSPSFLRASRPAMPPLPAAPDEGSCADDDDDDDARPPPLPSEPPPPALIVTPTSPLRSPNISYDFADIDTPPGISHIRPLIGAGATREASPPRGATYQPLKAPRPARNILGISGPARQLRADTSWMRPASRSPPPRDDDASTRDDAPGVGGSSDAQSDVQSVSESSQSLSTGPPAWSEQQRRAYLAALPRAQPPVAPELAPRPPLPPVPDTPPPPVPRTQAPVFPGPVRPTTRPAVPPKPRTLSSVYGTAAAEGERGSIVPPPRMAASRDGMLQRDGAIVPPPRAPSYRNTREMPDPARAPSYYDQAERELYQQQQPRARRSDIYERWAEYEALSYRGNGDGRPERENFSAKRDTRPAVSARAPGFFDAPPPSGRERRALSPRAQQYDDGHGRVAWPSSDSCSSGRSGTEYYYGQTAEPEVPRVARRGQRENTPPDQDWQARVPLKEQLAYYYA